MGNKDEGQQLKEDVQEAKENEILSLRAKEEHDKAAGFVKKFRKQAECAQKKSKDAKKKTEFYKQDNERLKSELAETKVW